MDQEIDYHYAWLWRLEHEHDAAYTGDRLVESEPAQDTEPAPEF